MADQSRRLGVSQPGRSTDDNADCFWGTDLVCYHRVYVLARHSRVPLAVQTCADGKRVRKDNRQADLEALALAARNAGQLREAVRYRYLHSLQLLEKAGLIARTKDKTNMDYLRELGRTGYHQPFASITLQYEYVWYGRMPLSETQYWRVNEAFDDFKNSLPK